MRRVIAFATIAIGLTTSMSTVSAETLYQNDSATDMLSGTFASAAVISDEMYEAVFEIPRSHLQEVTGTPLEMLGVQALFVKGDGGGTFCGRFSVEVWEEPVGAPTPSAEQFCDLGILTGGATSGRPTYKDPGSLIFSMSAIQSNGGPLGFEVQGQNRMGQTSLTEMRFSTVNSDPRLMVSIPPIYLNTSRIRVGLKALDLGCTTAGNNFPVLVSDLDGVAMPNTNFIKGSLVAFGSPVCSEQHYVWESFAPALMASQPGDWVLRLITNHGTTAPIDMGTVTDTGMADMLTDMGGGSDMSVTPDDMSMPPADMSVPPDDMGSGGEGDMDEPAPGALTITSISPSSGSNESSTDVVIVGTGFELGAEVILGATSIGVTETRGGTIKATVPEGLDEGLYDVIVTNPDDATAVLSEGFEVTSPMTDRSGGAEEGCGCDTSSASTTSAAGVLVALFMLALAFVRTRERDLVRVKKD